MLQTQNQAQELAQKERSTSGEGCHSLLTRLFRPVLDHRSWVAPKDTATPTVPTEELSLYSLAITWRVADAKRS